MNYIFSLLAVRPRSHVAVF